MYINVELSMLIKYSLPFFSSYLCMYVPLIVISYIEETCKMLCYDFPLFYVLSVLSALDVLLELVPFIYLR